MCADCYWEMSGMVSNASHATWLWYPQNILPVSYSCCRHDLTAKHIADEGDDQFGAEGGAAPPAPLGTTQLLDSVLHVSLHDFCHKFLADEVGSHLLPHAVVMCLCSDL